MTQVWLYTVASSNDPDRVECDVPWPVDEELIFFGPCKVRIRARLRRQYLSPERSYRKINDDLFIVGINGSNKERIRKVIWAGKLSEVMTFAKADRRLKGDRFQKLRMDRYSPLHVRPLQGRNGSLSGYEHRSEQHRANEDWVSDLVSAWRGFQKKGRSLILKDGWTPWEVFDRDCCILLENRFFAQGQGIEFDKDALKILKAVQPEKSEIDCYAVFGWTANGQANGLKGHYLAIEGELANRFVAWLEDRSHKEARHPQGDGTEPAKKSCTLHSSEPRRRTIC